jgi:2-polyprenyl-6-methoxyphenol hydroxylase-like FAD-dependent oxidoreductase
MAIPSPLPKSAMSLNILIVGAGVCGPALALHLQRSNPKHIITVIERYPTLRTGGQQIDLKAQGIPIMRKLGLLEEIRKHCVKESGMEFVDRNGKSLMQFGVTSADSEGGAFELTNEFEFMRGDFVKLMYDTSLAEREALQAKGEKEGGLTYEFGKNITALEQSASSNNVKVTFSSGQTSTFDLVVAADGQSSRTRKLAFGEATSKDSFMSLNIHAAYFNIPRLPQEDSLARIYFAPGNRMTMTRTGDRPVTQVYFFLLKDLQRSEQMRGVHKLPLDEQKYAWARIYADAGWDSKRFLEGMRGVEDFYATEIGQVKMPNHQIHTGRVVLLGDAGYCPSAFTGMGTTLSLIGTHVLAGELARHPTDVGAALKAYEETMKQPIAECQKLSGLGEGGGFYPASEWGIWAANNVLWTLSTFRVDRLLKWLAEFMPGGKEKRWELPEYPELNMADGSAM